MVPRLRRAWAGALDAMGMYMNELNVMTCSCGKRIGFKPEAAGRKGRCPACNTVMTLAPDAGTQPPINAGSVPVAAAMSPTAAKAPEAPAAARSAAPLVVVPGFPPDWKVREFGELETPLPVEYESLVRQRLTEAAEASGIWTREPLGALVRVTRIRALHLWSIARLTVTEKRVVKHAYIPYQNERLPKQTVKTADEINPDDYDFFKDDPDEGAQHADVDGSARVITCHECRAGKRPCPTCSGEGNKDCTACYGEGRLSCSECHGAGRVDGVRGQKNCTACRGLGTVDCPKCRKGHRKCPECGGEKVVLCPVCAGMKKAIQVLRVQAVRSCAVRQEEVSSPDLQPLLDLLKIESFRVDPEREVETNMGAYRAALSALPKDELVKLASVETTALNDTDDMPEDHKAVFFDFAMSGLTRSLELGAQMAAEDASDKGEAPSIGLPPCVRLAVPLPRPHPLAEVQKRQWFGVLGSPGAASCDSASSAVVGARVLTGNIRGSAVGVLPEVPCRQVAEAVDRCVAGRGGGAEDGRVVRDYVVVGVRSWIAADYELDGLQHVVFLGKTAAYAPTGSAIGAEPTRLVIEARELLETGNTAEAVSCVRRALSHELLRPDGEALASLLTDLPTMKVSVDAKNAVLAAVESYFKRVAPDLDATVRGFLWASHMATVYYKDGEIDDFSPYFTVTYKMNPGKTDPDDYDKFPFGHFPEAFFTIDLGRVNPALVAAVRQRIASIRGRKTGLVVAAIVAALIGAVVLAVALSGGRAPKQAAPFPAAAPTAPAPAMAPAAEPPSVPAEEPPRTERGRKLPRKGSKSR